jgi:hypothetical protein
MLNNYNIMLMVGMLKKVCVKSYAKLALCVTIIVISKIMPSSIVTKIVLKNREPKKQHPSLS